MQGCHSASPITYQLPAQFFNHSLSFSSNEPLSFPNKRQRASDKRTALVVDDVPDITEILAVMLHHAGYDVVTASSAPEALQAATKQHFDIVISDIGMPDMNGYQLVHHLRNTPGYESVPMVAVTGYSMFDDQERSLRAGFNAHVTKPIDPDALLDLLEQL
ncbi:MAG: response regulator [Pyrinomonadaceae bacterium]